MPFARPSKASFAIALGWFLAIAGGTTVAAASVLFDPGSAARGTRAFVTVAFGVAQFGLGLVAVAGIYRLYAHAQRIVGKRNSRNR